MTPPILFDSSVPPRAGQERFVLRGLDGLRAIAVVLVIVYHVWPMALPGGLVGVDLFFVISGYLITALLLREAGYTGMMHLPQFWMRRLRRLVPAMVLCVLVCTSVALFLGGDVLVEMPRQVMTSLTYTSNWANVVADNDYFTRTSPELFTNFWSLAVEEQFYLAWPIVLVTTCILVRSWRKRTLVPAVLATGSVVAMAAWTAAKGDMIRSYYGLDSHAFGLMFGAVLALMVPWSMYPPRQDTRVPAVEKAYSPGLNVVRILVGWGSLVLLPVLARFLTEEDPELLAPWGLVAASLLGLGVIQCLLPDVRGTGAAGLRRFLSLAPFEWVGKRSYGLYLWHWPMLTLMHYGAPTIWETPKNIGVLAATVVVAAASYKWLEQPVRRKGFLGATAALFRALKRPGNVRWAAVGAMLVAVVTVSGTVAACLQAPERTQAQSVISKGKDVLDQPETSPSATPSPSGPSPYEPTPDGKDVTMIGDSVTVSAADDLRSKMPGISVDAKVSREVSDGLDIARKQRDKHELGRIVVVSLSTNSGMTQEDVDTLTDLAESDQTREIVLVTGQAPPKLDWVKTSNETVRSAGKKSDKIVVADWAKASDGRPDLMVSDGVHPEPPGQDLYAQTVADAVGEAKKKLADRTASSGSAQD